ncbi:hypothetical protein CLU79DRAFT_707414 [Phycomyces nitens]|nr:hypothetical protein CLU79DRAFT_707414 [Phycomyces nitens]
MFNLPFVCDFKGCTKVFYRWFRFKSHIVTHLSKRNFICPHDECNAAFKRKSDLTRHIKRHANMNYVKCEYCDKKFVRKYNLKTHRSACPKKSS